MGTYCTPILPLVTQMPGTENMTFTQLSTPDFGSSNASAPREITESDLYYKSIQDLFNTKIIVVLCVLGILGNVLNIVVLSQKRFGSTIDHLEKCSHYGLVSLSVSDLLFCIAIIPHAWVKEQHVYDSLSFDLFYSVYRNALINTFIFSSTWLTVAMATARYISICKPIKSRVILGTTFAIASSALVFFMAVLFNIPRYWYESIERMECMEGHTSYYRDLSYMKRSKFSAWIYHWAYFIIGVIIPVVILSVCISLLSKALKHSVNMRKNFTQSHAHNSNNTNHSNCMTLTLVVIVILYAILVVPSEVVHFLDELFSDKYAEHTEAYNLAVAVANTLQSVNFALNFILYCIIYVRFRRTVKDLFSRKCRPLLNEKSYSHSQPPDYVMVPANGNNAPSVGANSMQSCKTILSEI